MLRWSWILNMIFSAEFALFTQAELSDNMRVSCQPRGDAAYHARVTLHVLGDLLSHRIMGSFRSTVPYWKEGLLEWSKSSIYRRSPENSPEIFDIDQAFRFFGNRQISSKEKKLTPLSLSMLLQQKTLAFVTYFRQRQKKKRFSQLINQDILLNPVEIVTT